MPVTCLIIPNSGLWFPWFWKGGGSLSRKQFGGEESPNTTGRDAA